MPQYLRYLRIAFSAVCGIAVILLCVLWVRSYWWMDLYGGHLSTYTIGCVSFPGAVGLEINSQAQQLAPWGYGSRRAEPWLDALKRQNSPYPSRVWGRFQFDQDAWFLPYWLLVVISITLATAPWLRKLRWRYSLKSLLLALTVVAVVLGLWASR
jgi:hypothetical protein